MRRPWPVFVVLAGALAVLVSLYLPWQEASCGTACLRANGGSVDGILNVFSRGLSIDAWSAGLGDAAAVGAVFLAVMAIAAAALPELTVRLPLGLGALVSGYTALALAAQARSEARYREMGMHGLRFHVAYGTVVGVAGGTVVLVAAAVLRRSELGHERRASRLVGPLLCAGLLVSLLLPWQEAAAGSHHVTFLGVNSPAGMVSAVACCVAATRWIGESSATERLAVVIITALFVVGSIRVSVPPYAHAYGAWVGLGVALALLALGLGGGAPGLREVRLPVGRAAFASAAAALLAVALFLPWERECLGNEPDLGPLSGACIPVYGWQALTGSVAAVLALMLVAAMVWHGVDAYSTELVVAIGLLITTLGFELALDTAGIQLAYGAFVGFAAAALLMVSALAGLRRAQFEPRSFLVRLVPIAACVAYLAIVVLPWWDVLPNRLEAQSLTGYAPPSWLTVAGAVLAVHLIGSWVRRIAVPSARASPLVAPPLVLLALAAVDLIRLRDTGITWGGGIVVGLCVCLAVLGHIEEQVGLEKARIPDVLRVDRL